MRLRLILAAVAVLALGAGAGAFWLRPDERLAVNAESVAAVIAVPSGQVVTLQDVVGNVPGPNGLTVRFRFLAPAIAKAGGGVPIETALRDMEALCNSYALTRIAEFGPAPAQIVISLSDVAVAFGTPAPNATQYFEAYSIKDNICIWDVF